MTSPAAEKVAAHASEWLEYAPPEEGFYWCPPEEGFYWCRPPVGERKTKDGFVTVYGDPVVKYSGGARTFSCHLWLHEKIAPPQNKSGLSKVRGGVVKNPGPRG